MNQTYQVSLSNNPAGADGQEIVIAMRILLTAAQQER